jgi:hypothetical protein
VTETLHRVANVQKEGKFWLAVSAKQAILWLPNHGRFLLHLKPRFVGAFFGVPSMNDSLEVESSIQPDGGEGLAKRKGVVARRGLKEAWSKAAARWTRTG